MSGVQACISDCIQETGYSWAPTTGTLREDQHVFTTVVFTDVTMVVFCKVSSGSVVGTLLAMLSGVAGYLAPRESKRSEHIYLLHVAESSLRS